jgi:hypothetical protein
MRIVTACLAFSVVAVMSVAAVDAVRLESGLIGPALAAPISKLAPPDIQAAFFTGKAFTASTPSNVKYKMTFTPDGKVTREPMARGGAKGEGSWSLSKDGFCTTWKGAKANCFTLVSAGDNKGSVMRGTTLIAVWTK